MAGVRPGYRRFDLELKRRTREWRKKYRAWTIRPRVVRGIEVKKPVPPPPPPKPTVMLAPKPEKPPEAKE